MAETDANGQSAKSGSCVRTDPHEKKKKKKKKKRKKKKKEKKKEKKRTRPL